MKHECYVSTGIHGGLTFGSGELSDYGYWSKPCLICARKNDSEQKDDRAKIGRSMNQEGCSNRQVRKYIAQAEWLWLESWPYQEI